MKRLGLTLDALRILLLLSMLNVQIVAYSVESCKASLTDSERIAIAPDDVGGPVVETSSMRARRPGCVNINARVASLREKADAAARAHDFVKEAAFHDQILWLLPADPLALRGRVFAVLKMGAPHLAKRFADQHPSLFRADELAMFRQAAAGRSTRWGSIEAKTGIGRKRFEASSRALRQLEETRAHEPLAGNTGHYADFDRLVGLRDNLRMHAAIDAYEHLTKRGIAIPAYALAAVADAYLYLRLPKHARDLYSQALEYSRGDREYPNREWQLRLFDAFIDLNDFAAAQALIDKLVDEIPPVLNRGIRGVEVSNPLYEEARTDAARARIYADRFDEGQTLLDGALERAPFSFDLRIAQADLLRFRGQPRAAQSAYVGVLIDDPANLFAANGIAETAVLLDDLAIADARIRELTAHYPELREVQRVERLVRAYRAPRVTIEAGGGSSPTGGGIRGSNDWFVDAVVESEPLTPEWRLFAHTYNATADFSTITGTRDRIGVGGQYRDPAWHLSAELNQDQNAIDHIGAQLRANWLPDDHWRLNLGYDVDSNDIPLQASAAGISMARLSFGAAYRKNESREVNAVVSLGWFSDGNRRIEAGAEWQERWVGGPVYKLDTLLSISTSENSSLATTYFNPRRDVSANAELINEWTVWRRYRRSIKHRLILSAGKYWQQDFDSGFTTTLRYEHEWILNDFRHLTLGVVYERHPYDGLDNERTGGYLNLSWNL